MKKKIFAAAVAFVATMSLATSAFAAAPGATNGSATTEVTVKADAPTEFKTENNLVLEAPAGAFEAGSNVKLDANVEAVTNVPAAAATVESAIAKIASVSGNNAKATVNTKLEISLTSNGTAVQPNGKVKLKSNILKIKSIYHNYKTNIIKG